MRQIPFAKPRQVEPGLLSTMRGHDISPAFVGGGIPALRPADRPLLWEWRYNIEGPCYMEAPQLAVLDRTWAMGLQTLALAPERFSEALLF